MTRLFMSSFVVILLGTGFAFISQLWLAKILPAEEYGIYSFVFSLSMLLSVFALFGFQNSAVRLIPTYMEHPEQAAAVPAFIRFSRLLTGGLALLSGVMVYGGLYLFGYTETYPVAALIIGVLLVPLMVSMRLYAAFLRGFHKSTLSVLYESTLREGLFLAVLAAVFFSGLPLTHGLAALLAMLAVQIAVSGLSALQCRRHIPPRPENNLPLRSSYRDWLSVSFPLMLVMVSQRLMRRSDIIILGLMVNPALVGAYAIAAQFSEVASISQKVVQSVFSPQAAQAYAAGNVSRLRTLYRQNLIFSVLCSGGMSLGIVLIVPYIFAFLGDGFETAWNALLILLAGHFIMVCTGPSAALLAMTRYEKTIMNITLIAAIGNILLNIPFIYWFGLEGSAMVTAFFVVFRNVVGYIYVVRYRILTTPQTP